VAFTISAVSRARRSGELKMRVIPRLARRGAAAAA
jgi:hypothetical protein